MLSHTACTAYCLTATQFVSHSLSQSHSLYLTACITQPVSHFLPPYKCRCIPSHFLSNAQTLQAISSPRLFCAVWCICEASGPAVSHVPIQTSHSVQTMSCLFASLQRCLVCLSSFCRAVLHAPIQTLHSVQTLSLLASCLCSLVCLSSFWPCSIACTPIQTSHSLQTMSCLLASLLRSLVCLSSFWPCSIACTHPNIALLTH